MNMVFQSPLYQAVAAGLKSRSVVNPAVEGPISPTLWCIPCQGPYLLDGLLVLCGPLLL